MAIIVASSRMAAGESASLGAATRYNKQKKQHRFINVQRFSFCGAGAPVVELVFGKATCGRMTVVRPQLQVFVGGSKLTYDEPDAATMFPRLWS
jgi:hypothetical protein